MNSPPFSTILLSAVHYSSSPAVLYNSAVAVNDAPTIGCLSNCSCQWFQANLSTFRTVSGEGATDEWQGLFWPIHMFSLISVSSLPRRQAESFYSHRYGSKKESCLLAQSQLFICLMKGFDLQHPQERFGWCVQRFSATCDVWSAEIKLSDST